MVQILSDNTISGMIRIPSLGLLRLGLLCLATVDILLPVADSVMASLSSGEGAESPVWTAVATLVAPVMAPILIVVILFDVIMLRVRIIDAEGESQRRYTAILRIELAAMGVMLLYWVPFFLTLR
jgi:hypothetical protein